MTPTRDELVTGAAQRGKDKNSRRLLMLLGTVLTFSIVALLISGYLLWVKKQDQALAGKDLAIQVQQACQSTTTAEQLGSICKQAKAVEKQISAGPQGPPGLDGRDGRDGVNGTNGADGIDGRDGAPGANGVNGTNGVDGKDGAPGPAGPEGPPGKNGQDGSNGTDGKDAYPMTWSFKFSPNPMQDYSFLCTLIDPAQQVTCTPQ